MHSDREDEDPKTTSGSEALYPLESFLRDFSELRKRRMWDQQDSGSDFGSFASGLLRFTSAFGEFHQGEKGVAHLRKFLIIMHHFQKHGSAYGLSPSGIVPCEDISEPILASVHWHYAVRPESEWGSADEDIPKIKEWASHWGKKP